jgi:hypothetical protein
MAELPPRILQWDFETKVEQINEDRIYLGCARVLDIVSPDPNLAAHVAMGQPCRNNKVREIDPQSLKAIVETALKRAAVWQNEEFVVCVILGSIPYIDVILDRGTYKKGPRDKFQDDVWALTKRKTDTFIPVMLVNPNIPHCLLTYVELK